MKFFGMYLLILHSLIWGGDVMAAPRTSNVTYSLSENSPSNSYLGNLYTDTSIRTLFGSNTRNNLRYHKVTTSNPQAGFFKVHPRSGNLSTASVIDREAVCPKMTNCVLKFEVLLRPNQYFTVITVTVIIEDVNDNTPSFTQGSITLSVSEGTYPGETFLLPTPSDNDSPKFGIVSYDLRSNNSHFGLKKVNNGDSDLLMLRINSRLDREVSHKYHMTLSATDGGNPSKTGILDINVNVADINDNRPVFSNSSYIIYIPEDVKIGSVILNCTATDADVGLNGEIKYTLSSTSSLQYGSLFEINEITGALSVKDNLNYETQPLIVLTVKAQDQGPSSIPTFARVTIHLIDENDNDPTITFQQSDHRPYLSISENSPVGSVVSYLTIWDPDEGQNGNVSCVVIGRNFTLQQLFKSEYQLIVANPLPTVKGLEYLVTIVCEDHGRIRRKTEKTVLVKVEDINDHAPEFDQPEYTVKIDENISVGTSVLRVVATDGDSGNNSKISYFLFDRDNHFQIDRNYGIIYSNAEIDYESRQGYVFIVMARDHGKPPKSTNTTLRIVVNNRNDEKPEFRNNPIVLGIRENEPVNSEVGTVVAYDRDSPPLNDIRYSLRKDSEMEPAFKINANTGVISTIKDLDRETKSLYRLTVHATDAHDSSLFSTASVTIHIADANDHRPVFKFPTSKGSKNSITVTSSDEIGHIVCHVIVSDEDAGQNGKFFHSIKSGNNDKLFAINPRSGVITLNKNLPSNKKIYDLIIVAQDYGKTPLWSEEHLYILVNHTGSSMASAITDPMYPLPPVVGVSVAAGIIILALGLLLINLRFEIFSRRKCCCGRFASKDNINRDIGQAMAKVPNKEAALEQGYQGQNIMDCNKQNNLLQAADIQPQQAGSDSDSGKGFSDSEQWPAKQDFQIIPTDSRTVHTFGRKRKSSEGSYAIYPNCQTPFNPAVSCDTIEQPDVILNHQKPWYLQNESDIIQYTCTKVEPEYVDVFPLTSMPQRGSRARQSLQSQGSSSQQYHTEPHSRNSEQFSDSAYPVDIPKTNISDEYFPTENFGRIYSSEVFASTDTELQVHRDDDTESVDSAHNLYAVV